MYDLTLLMNLSSSPPCWAGPGGLQSLAYGSAHRFEILHGDIEIASEAQRWFDVVAKWTSDLFDFEWALAVAKELGLAVQVVCWVSLFHELHVNEVAFLDLRRRSVIVVVVDFHFISEIWQASHTSCWIRLCRSPTFVG